jgi:hypothetical protein
LKSSDPAAVLYAKRHQHLSAASVQPLVVVRIGDEQQAQSDHIAQGGKSMMEESGMLEDIDTPAEVEFMHAVQDYLLDRYDRIGLIIGPIPRQTFISPGSKSTANIPFFAGARLMRHSGG